MKQVVVHETILKDERFQSLTLKLTSLNNALGLWLKALILFSHKKTRVMSKSDWLLNSLGEELLQANLFELNEDGKIEMVSPLHCDFIDVEPKEYRMTPQDLQLLWNANCGKLPKVKELTPDRRQKATARIKECDDQEVWLKVIDYIANSPFHRGLNDRNWRADFAYLLKPGTRPGILEKLGSQTNRADIEM